MARLTVDEIDEKLLEWFAHRARRLGQSEEELARFLIEREARSEQTWQTLEDSTTRMRDRLKSLGRYEAARPIRKHTDR
ncbi:MAG: hypothetical protein ACT443_10995 [Gemmatimonadota bacterium]